MHACIYIFIYGIIIVFSFAFYYHKAAYRGKKQFSDTHNILKQKLALLKKCKTPQKLYLQESVIAFVIFEILPREI